MNKVILLTGATGYLGSRIAAALLAQGDRVVALKRKSSSLQRIGASMAKIALYDGEDLDMAIPFSAHGKIDAVIHTATCYGRHNESADAIAAANILFPLKVLDAATANGVDTFINTDTSLDKHLNAYSLSKKHFAEWGKYLVSNRAMRFLNVRLEQFYGPGEDESKFTAHVIRHCLNNAPELKLTAGEQKRDFIYIDDVVAAYLTLLEKKDALATGYAEFDVGSGAAISIREFTETVQRMTKSTTRLAFGALPYREGEVMFSQAQTAAISRLGWHNLHTLEQGLQLTIEGQRA